MYPRLPRDEQRLMVAKKPEAVVMLQLQLSHPSNPVSHFDPSQTDNHSYANHCVS